jgi:hypothetical protein
VLDKYEDARLKKPENVSLAIKQLSADKELTPAR